MTDYSATPAPYLQFKAALGLQLRVIGALILRETRATYGTSQIGYLWAILKPVAATAVLVAIFQAMGRHPPVGSSLALFFVCGLSAFELFNKLRGSLMKAFDANKALLTYPPIKETDVLIARAALIGATHALITMAMFGGLIILDMADWPAHPEEMFLAMSVTFLLGFGWGTVNGVIFSFWASWEIVEGLLGRPLFWLSAIFYVPSFMPSQFVAWLSWNPVLHCVEWMRIGQYSNYNSSVLDKAYPVWIALVLVFIGLAGERIIHRRIGPVND